MNKTTRYQYLQKTAVLLIVLQLFRFCSPAKHPDYTQLITSVKSRFAPDSRTALFDVEISSKNSKLVLTGETTVPEARLALLDSLGKQCWPVTDSILVLPDASVGESCWGLVNLSCANMRSGPVHSSEMVSQVLLGAPVKILQRARGWYRIQTADEYIGWLDSSALKPVTGLELDNWKSSKRYVYIKTEGSAYSLPNESSLPVSDLVLGNLFSVTDETAGFLHMQFPDGRIGFVLKTDCRLFTEWASATPKISRIIETAYSLLGRPYLWGGTSVKGLDCSGLIKTAYLSQGIILARDASQQARYGEMLSVGDSADYEIGDLLFFGSNPDRITHVAMYIGDDHYIHAAGCVRINSLNPEHDDFSLSRKNELVSASRVLNAICPTQIGLIKHHPWYN